MLDDRVQSLRRRPGEEFMAVGLNKTELFPTVHGTNRLHVVGGTMSHVKYVEYLKALYYLKYGNSIVKRPNR